MTDIEIRPVSAAEFDTAIEWAAAEGWNPGLDDLAVFHAADPNGFLMGFAGDEPISSISVVRYGAGFGFLGFYIVTPDSRSTGAGMAIWNQGMAHLAGRTVGLDGVVDQQDNYHKSGFQYAGRNIRHTGVPAMGGVKFSMDVRDVEATDLASLQTYDHILFPAERKHFTETWVLPQMGERRRANIALKDGYVAGYGVIRACRAGHKIGPLFADDEQTATMLMRALSATVGHEEEVSLDTPEENKAAVALAEAIGLKPVFETARMYRGEAPILPPERIFGIMTFELG
ncbi:MAG: GNAT family N-acetyltransferase [Alphaproteobacteria bacterium]|nr:GNAT family N-acetyltransferase [Alphaproteobacteria bacterium]